MVWFWICLIIGIAILIYNYIVYAPPMSPLTPDATKESWELCFAHHKWMTKTSRLSMDHKIYMKYTYLYEYVKKGRRKSNDTEKEFIRNVIWNFKEGRYDDELAQRTALLIKKVVNKPEKKILICIPASNSMRNEQRYRRFSQDVCKLSGVQNGFDIIKVILTRKQEHLSENRGIPLWEWFLETDVKKLDGRDVILLDDVLTTGNSYGSFKDYLEKKGANVKCGIFLATVPENKSWP